MKTGALQDILDLNRKPIKKGSELEEVLRQDADMLGKEQLNALGRIIRETCEITSPHKKFKFIKLTVLRSRCISVKYVPN